MSNILCAITSIITGSVLLIGDNARGVEWFILGVLYMILGELEKMNVKKS